MLQAMRTRAAAITASGALAIVACTHAGTEPPPAPRPAETAPAAQATTQTPSGQRVNADAALAADFTKRVQEYMALHKKAVAKVSNLPKEATPEQIDRHQRALAREIQNVRRGAKAGDIFTQETRAYVRRQIASAFAGPEGKRLRGSIMDENPGPIKLAPNGRYPDTVPLATMPPQVLSALPKLPPELEFRFIGNRLILLDVPAHLVVDFIEGALPE